MAAVAASPKLSSPSSVEFAHRRAGLLGYFLEIQGRLKGKYNQLAEFLSKAASADAAKTKERRYIPIVPAGEGGFGVVFQGETISKDGHKKTIAIKISKANQEALLRAQYEKAALAEITKDKAPHCVHLIDSSLEKSESGVTQTIVMDLAEGATLTNYFKKLSLKDIKIIARALLEHLVYLRSKRMVHGDLTPLNIFYDPKTGKVKVIDYGSAHKIDEDYPMLFQNIAYRAPEVILGGPHDIRVDVWSVGCILADLLLCDYQFSNEGEECDISTYDKQLEMYVKQLRLPAYRDIKDGKLSRLFFTIDDERQQVLGFRGEVDKTPYLRWQDKVRKREVNKDLDCCLDFLTRMIAWDRPFPEDLLKHPFVGA
ncbi:MAG TPA: protein kinase [Chlamydiales bacterium]|nr:protein kinase [Chlamydiales bacterium]